MSETNVFQEASRRKLRFVAPNGFLTSEDLWDLSLKQLDGMAVTIDTELGKARKSFLDNPDRAVTAARTEDELRLEILKAVITTKQEENAAKRASQDKAARKAFLTNLLQKKQIDQLESLPIEDIEKELAALEA